MEHYVTLFDGGFLPQGLALYRSLRRHAGEFTLWILCMDDTAHAVLGSLGLAGVRLIRLGDVETPALLEAKKGRTRAEYCWTMTPFAALAVLSEDPSVRRVTYLDADFWFLKSPGGLFTEMESAGKSVLITDHAYAPEYDQSATSGRFCVQFVTFNRDGGLEVLEWWAARCLEWCFARFEDGKFGDQKYLDQWPERFPQVHVLTRLEWLLAPWNAVRFPCRAAVAFHFHGLRLLEGGDVLLYRGYEIPAETRREVYQPYAEDLAAALNMLSGIGHAATPQGKRPGVLVAAAIVLKKLLRGSLRVRPLEVIRLGSQSSRR